MTPNIRSTERAFTVTVGCAVVLATATATPVHAQRVSTRTTVTAPAPAPVDLNQLRKQLVELEKRVKELEEDKVIDVKDEAEDDARAKQLEQRLASLEAALGGGKSDNKTGSRPGPSSPTASQSMTVKAPFVVQDDAGNTIFRVELNPAQGNRPRVALGNPNGTRVQLSLNPAGGGSIGLFGAQDQAIAYMSSTPTESFLSVTSGSIAASMRATPSGSTFKAFNRKDVPAAELSSSPNGYGGLTLTRPDGTPTVVGGTLENGLGYVGVGPSFGCAQGALTFPCKLLGHK